MNKISSQPEAAAIEKSARPFQEFVSSEASGGIFLIGCTVIALAWANSPWADSYFHLWHTKLTIGFAGALLSEELHFWINDGLMAVFFLLVGLEIKREALIGELASFRKAALPVAAAFGGMLVPAVFYALINRSGPGSAGWGIPMATDIAFALGVLTLLGNRVPASLKVFLTALAIADDIGAVLVIALFYTAQISWINLGVAGVFYGALIAMNRAGARHPLIYAVLGIGLWLAFLQSGIHATIAGFLLALTIPARSGKIPGVFQRVGEAGGGIEAGTTKNAVLPVPAVDWARAKSPMIRFEHALIPWIKYLVMPVFALANAGVALGDGAAGVLVDPISVGIICGLVLGKPVGIILFSWLATRSGVAALPAGVAWRQMSGAGLLAGIGFTMSLFVANLAFGATPTLEVAKVGILAASLVAGIVGSVVLSRSASGANPVQAHP